MRLNEGVCDAERWYMVGMGGVAFSKLEAVSLRNPSDIPSVTRTIDDAAMRLGSKRNAQRGNCLYSGGDLLDSSSIQLFVELDFWILNDRREDLDTSVNLRYGQQPSRPH